MCGVVIRLANHAINAPTDSNGPGASRTVRIDVSALDTFTSGSQLTIDASNSVTSGPTAVSVTPSSQMMLSLSEYGAAFLTPKERALILSRSMWN